MVEKWSKKIENTVKLDIYRIQEDGEPKIESRWKAFVSEKNKPIGKKMIEILMALFDIDTKDIKQQHKEELDEEKKYQMELLDKKLNKIN